MKNIVLFGTGKYFENYIVAHPQNTSEDKNIDSVIFAVDSNTALWGTQKHGIEIKSPDSLANLQPSSFYVIICMKDASSAEEYLETKGIFDYQKYYPIPMEDREIVTYVNEKKVDASEYLRSIGILEEKMVSPYEIGYVPGVFDLFHIGHLNLIRNSKKRCEYLIVGVLTDELVFYFKQRYPIIPYAQRAAIIEALGIVDRVVPVDFDNTYKIDAWKKYHYDCHFSGDDHGLDWTRDLAQLREVGSNMEFFKYTQATSSTEIKKKISQ